MITLQNNLQVPKAILQIKNEPTVGELLVYSTGQILSGTGKTINDLGISVFEPTGGDDTAAFIAYAEEQLAKKQPIYFFGQNFNLQGLTHAPTTNAYQKLAWIGISNGINDVPPIITLSGTNTLLVGAGIRGLNLQINNGATLNLMGYSNQVEYNFGQVKLMPNAVLNLLACVVKCRTMKSESTGDRTVFIDNRSHLDVTETTGRNGTINVAGLLTGVQVGWTWLNVGWTGSATADNAMVRIARRAYGAIRIRGNYCIFIGSPKTNIEIMSGASHNTIVGIWGITNNSGNSTNYGTQGQIL